MESTALRRELPGAATLQVDSSTIPMSGIWRFLDLAVAAGVFTLAWCLYGLLGNLTFLAGPAAAAIAGGLGGGLSILVFRFADIIWKLVGPRIEQRHLATLLMRTRPCEASTDILIRGTAVDLLKLCEVGAEVFEPVVFRRAMRLGRLNWRDCAVCWLVGGQIPMVYCVSQGSSLTWLACVAVALACTCVPIVRHIISPGYVRVVPGKVHYLRGSAHMAELQLERSVCLRGSRVEVDLSRTCDYIRVIGDGEALLTVGEADVYAPFVLACLIARARLSATTELSVPSDAFVG